MARSKAAMRETIALIKRTIRATVTTALWPITTLIANAKRANKRAVFWALRHGKPLAYFSATLWPSLIPITIAVWVALTVGPPDNYSMSPGMFTFNKWLAVATLVVKLLEKVVDHYLVPWWRCSKIRARSAAKRR